MGRMTAAFEFGAPFLGRLLPGNPVVEAATPADLPALSDLHAASFPHPWDIDELAALLASPGVQCLVIRRPSLVVSRKPVAFVIYRLVADEAEILTIAVHPRWRRGGLGASLVDAAKRRLYAERAAALFLEVDSENAAALALYRRRGFVQVGTRPGYYAHASGRGHALVMRCDLR